MEAVFKIIGEKKFIGRRLRMSFSNNRTVELWRSFMPGRKEIKNNISPLLYSIEIYEPFYFRDFNPDREFEKWAAVEVSDFETMAAGMEPFSSPGGLYAVFLHQGPASEGPKSYQYIFLTWFPGSDYIPDDRPHFAVMGERYKGDSPDSEEELWIPVRKK